MSSLTLEDGTDKLSRKVDNYQFTVGSIPEYRKSNLPCCGSL